MLQVCVTIRWTSVPQCVTLSLSLSISLSLPCFILIFFSLSLSRSMCLSPLRCLSCISPAPNDAMPVHVSAGPYSALSLDIHPVSITRFPLTRFSPGAGLLRNPFVHRSLRFSRVWVRKDGNLVMETGCTLPCL